MYKVSIFNEGIENVIHSPLTNSLKLSSGIIKKEINKIDSFSIDFNMNNPAFGKLQPFKTLVKVFNTKTDKYEFEGRVLSPTEAVSEDGLYSASYVCEGELGYLHDSQQKHDEYRGTPLALVTQLLDYHNQQVESYKHFEVGNIEVTNNTDNLYVYLSAEKTTFEEIEDKILNRVGGELQIRKENGIRYLDILNRIGSNKSTKIKIAKNLKSISRSVDPTEIITRLTPLGTRIESEDEEATDASQARLTIESVNNNVPYIDDAALIDVFGIKGGQVVWDDITLASRLLSSAQNWLANQKVAHVQYDLSALDLSLIGLDIDNFYIGNSHPVINPIMNIDEDLRIIGKTTDINNPHNASLKIGDKFKTLSEYQVDAKRAENKVVDLERIIDGQSKRLNEIKGELEDVNISIGDLEQALADADIEAIEGAISDLNDAIDNLSDAIDQIPDYDKATSSTDGLMPKEDKAKLDLISVLNSIDLDDLKSKLDLITVINPIDLDDLLQRVIDLENQ